MPGRRVPAQWVEEALDVAEAGYAGLGLLAEAAAGEQLAFEGREEALSYGVVVGVADRVHRRSSAWLLYWPLSVSDVYCDPCSE